MLSKRLLAFLIITCMATQLPLFLMLKAYCLFIRNSSNPQKFTPKWMGCYYPRIPFMDTSSVMPFEAESCLGKKISAPLQIFRSSKIQIREWSRGMMIKEKKKTLKCSGSIYICGISDTTTDLNQTIFSYFLTRFVKEPECFNWIGDYCVSPYGYFSRNEV